MVALGSLGAGTLPLAVGAISDRAGSLAAGFATLEVSVALLLALQLWRVYSNAQRL